MAQGGLSRLGCTPDSVKLVYLDLHLSVSVYYILSVVSEIIIAGKKLLLFIRRDYKIANMESSNCIFFF